MLFKDLNLDPKVLQAVEEAGYTEPTPIQAQAIPHALEGRDILGIAQTGTGKTASFTLPMIHALSKGRARARMPRSLILCPTRELAAQVSANFETYGKYHRLTMALLIGGVNFNEQDKLIDRGVDVLIATPGRLLDHFERGKLMLTGIQVMVVDEADRMLDMGFIPDLERIFNLTPFTRQTLFFSATMPPEITRLTQTFLSNPVRVEVARQATTAENITQSVCVFKASRKDAAAKEKRNCLRALMEREGEKLTNAIIFCNRKVDVGIVHKSLVKHDYNAGALHGDLDQSVRTATLTAFRDGEIKILVASDVAARGLDIPAVSHVFNFDVPTHSEDYVHRIGRTGRAGRDGTAITLCLSHEEKYLAQIEELIEREIPRAEVPEGITAGEQRSRGRKGEGDAGSDATQRRGRKNGDEAGATEEKPRRGRRAKREETAVETEADEASANAGSEAAKETSDADTGENRARKPRRGRKSDDAGDQDRNSGRRGSGDDGGRRRGGGRRGNDDRVVGMGDHVPAFLMREVRPNREASGGKSGDDANGDDGDGQDAGAAA